VNDRLESLPEILPGESEISPTDSPNFLQSDSPLFTRIIQLENRVAFLESEQARFTNALISAGKFLFENPASKMMLMAFPKEMQIKLKEFFDGTQTGR